MSCMLERLLLGLCPSHEDNAANQSFRANHLFGSKRFERSTLDAASRLTRGTGHPEYRASAYRKVELFNKSLHMRDVPI